jgi:hypothetical protein
MDRSRDQNSSVRSSLRRCGLATLTTARLHAHCWTAEKQHAFIDELVALVAGPVASPFGS